MAVVALPLVLFSTIVLLGLTGAAAAVGAYGFFAKGLPDPAAALEAITFTTQSTVYDRTGGVLLAKLGADRREVVAYAQIPPVLIDATTSVEDKTFWENSGFDPLGFVSAAIDTLQGRDRGGSTITQQLVRNRLLSADVLNGSVYERKIKEIIQSIRLTSAYPGQVGKEQIMEKYLNQNFYGNRSYGVGAAAQSYWGKPLQDLTIAQMALLAGIPKAPTAFDLLKNAVAQTVTGTDGKDVTQLVVPQDSQVVQRRNMILDLMKTRSVLTKGRYTDADYEAAKVEPVILAPQAAEAWKASQFVWQVRNELDQLLCGSLQCQKVDTGGYRVVTTLDYTMQLSVEKWLYAGAIIPNRSSQTSLLKGHEIPKSEWSWIQGLTGRNIHNAAAGIVDYRTGEVLAYSGSASQNEPGNKKFQPQFDVLTDGWRQPGSSIKPIDYLIGIDDHTLTAATMFMDVVTNFALTGQAPFYPTQSDVLERGPVRLRSALGFSLNIPAIKAGFINGLQHQLDRSKDFGLRYPTGTFPVVSESIGTLEIHPVDMISAYGAIANGGVLMPRHMILKVIGPDGVQVYPAPGTKITGTRVVSAAAAYILTDILAGNTVPSVNPFWAVWRVTDGVSGKVGRPAAYKTGTTSDNRDVHAYGYLAPPDDKSLPALVAGVWMGNSDNSPNDGKLSLETSAPLWSAILSEVSKGMPITNFGGSKPSGLETVAIDAFTGMKPGPTTVKTIKELFIKGTAPTTEANIATTADIDTASGLLWQDGCVGPMVTKAFVDYSSLEAGFPVWQAADLAWQARAAKGSYQPGPPIGPKDNERRPRTSYFYGPGFYPYGKTWGGAFAPTKRCPIGIAPSPSACIPDPLGTPCPSLPPPPSPSPSPSGRRSKKWRRLALTPAG